MNSRPINAFKITNAALNYIKASMTIHKNYDITDASQRMIFIDLSIIVNVLKSGYKRFLKSRCITQVQHLFGKNVFFFKIFYNIKTWLNNCG